MSETKENTIDRDLEVEAMGAIARALDGFSREDCARILEWAADKYAECVLHRVKKSDSSRMIRARDYGAKWQFNP